MGLETIFAGASFIALVATWFALPGAAKPATERKSHVRALETERSLA